MQVHLLVGQNVTAIGSPITGAKAPSNAKLSNVAYSSSDTSVFTVAPDPNTPNGAIVTAVGAGSATLEETALATEADGVTTEEISGSATVVVTVKIEPAAALDITFGTPTTP